MKLDWVPLALADRDGQLAYVGERNPWAAIDLGDAIEMAVARLMDYPFRGRPGRISGTRELVVGGTPYLIVYRVEPNAVVLLRLLHGAQRWPNMV